jgi:hypothetical protein
VSRVESRELFCELLMDELKVWGEAPLIFSASRKKKVAASPWSVLSQSENTFRFNSIMLIRN